MSLNSKKAFIQELIGQNKNTTINFNIDNQDKILNISEDNQSRTPKANNINNDNYSTLKNQYYTQFEKVFDKYKNELSDEEKNKLKKRYIRWIFVTIP